MKSLELNFLRLYTDITKLLPQATTVFTTPSSDLEGTLGFSIKYPLVDVSVDLKYSGYVYLNYSYNGNDTVLVNVELVYFAEDGLKTTSVNVIDKSKHIKEKINTFMLSLTTITVELVLNHLRDILSQYGKTPYISTTDYVTNYMLDFILNNLDRSKVGYMLTVSDVYNVDPSRARKVTYKLENPYIKDKKLHSVITHKKVSITVTYNDNGCSLVCLPFMDSPTTKKNRVDLTENNINLLFKKGAVLLQKYLNHFNS